MMEEDEQDEPSVEEIDRRLKEIHQRWLVDWKGDIARAEAGDIGAMSKLLLRYRSGRLGLARDMERADYWEHRLVARQRELAKTGDPKEMYKWGDWLRKGVYVPQDVAAGVDWVRRATGWYQARLDYARWMLHGAFGVPKDESGGLARLLREAVESNGSFRYRLASDIACCYHYGVGTAKDEDEAVRWYILGVQGSDGVFPTDWLAIAGEYERRGDLTAAFHWYQEALGEDYHDPEVEKIVGMWLYCGKGTPRDVARAKKLLAHAAEVGGDDDAAKLYYFILDEEKHGLCGRTPTCLPVDVPPLNYEWSPIQ